MALHNAEQALHNAHNPQPEEPEEEYSEIDETVLGSFEEPGYADDF
jgi:hypothetical protein